MKAFKILDRETGLYASPGYPGWTKNGKAWASPGAIAGHLALPGRSEQYRGERYAVVMFDGCQNLGDIC